jgi:galactose oxidase-like protein/Kelch motif protein
MTESDFELFLRAGLREMVDDGATSTLRARILAIPAVESVIPQRGFAGRWGFGRTNRFATIALAATAVAVALLIGIGLLVRSPDVGPSPIPGPTNSATVEPSQTSEPFRAASWTTTGSMADPRFDFTATLLADGRVLVAGGDLGYDANPRALASAELYDPSSGTWTPTGSMLTGRYRHTATLLPNGEVLVAGGNVNNSNVIGISCCLATAELYDPSTGTWTATGSMNAPRVAHWATLLPDGTVLVAGGDAYPNTGLERFPTEVYNPGTESWSATESEISVGHDLTATLLPDGRVLFLSTTLFDPTTGSWSNTLGCCLGGDPDTYYGSGTATLLSDGHVLRAGGFGRVPNTEPGLTSRSVALVTAALYDPLGGGWRATGSLHVGRVDATATLLSDGRVLMVGGNTEGFPTTALNTAELYDPGTGVWDMTSSLAEGRFAQKAILLLDGTVLVVGGYDTSALASAELYDPAIGS